jgi:hypothetical protein
MAQQYKQGWEAGPGSDTMVKNSRTGQVLDIYSPHYQDDTQAPPPVLPPGQPGSTPLNQGPQNATQAITQQANVGSQANPGQPATVAGSFQQALINKLNAPRMTQNSPEVQPAIQANQLSNQRGFERDRAMLAERNAAQGINNSGGADSMLRGLSQDRALRESQFAGDTVLNANKQQSAELLAALGLTGNLLQGIDARDLTRYGIDQDAQLRREGLGATTDLGNRDIDLRGELGRANLNLGLASLLQGGEQFGQSLSSQNAQFGAGLNQQALLSLLGAL